MNETRPPIGPGQLPPRTDDFTFCNASSVDTGPVHFEANGVGPPFHANIPTIGHRGTHSFEVPPILQAHHVMCHVDFPIPGQPPLEYEYDAAPGWYVTRMICGAEDGDDGSVVPFGLVILQGPEPGQFCVRAIRNLGASCPPD